MTKRKNGSKGLFIEKQSTGVEIWQITTEEVPQSNIYCEVPYCSEDSHHFVYERRTGKDPLNPTEFVLVEMATWEQRALARSESLSGSAITPDGRLYYVYREDPDTRVLFRVKLPDGSPEAVYSFGDKIWWGSLGTVSSDHRFYVRSVRLGDSYDRFGIVLVDLSSGKEQVIDEDPFILNAHPQFDPGNANRLLVQHNRGGQYDDKGKLLNLVGEEGATLYVLSVPGGERTELPVGKPFTTPCTGHEAWAGTAGEVILSVAASGNFAPEKGNLLGVFPGQEEARIVAKGFRANHVGLSRCGRYFCVDDWRDTYKLFVGSVRTGKTALLCESFTQPNRKQNSHPHAYLTPDLQWALFNSNRSGFSHIYAAKVPEGMLEGLL